MGISINSVFFIIYSIVLVLSSILSIISKKMVYTLLFAMIVFLMVGGLFVILGATYNAMVQFLIYVVAIPVLIAVSVMLFNKSSDDENIIINSKKFWVIIGVLLFTLVIGEFISINKESFNLIKSCTVYVNQYSDLMSISMNILGAYPVLLLEFGFAVLLVVIGLTYYEK